MSAAQRIRGAGTALVTPFRGDGALDLPAFRALVRRQVEAGIDLLIPCGTTGESATLSREERERLVRAAVEEARGRALVVAGTGSNDTRLAVEQAREAASWGAGAALSLAPPYNKPPQDALIEHFASVAEGAGIPVVVYNVPGRTSCNLEARTTIELARRPGIAAIKEASGNLSQIMEILRGRPAGFSVLSGDDSFTFPLLALGADGVISVVGNEAPGDLASLVDLCFAGRWDEARAIHERLLPLMEANFCESNPIPVKAAMAEMGLLENVLRRPLRPLAEAKAKVLRDALAAAGIAAGARAAAGEAGR